MKYLYVCLTGLLVSGSASAGLTELLSSGEASLQNSLASNLQGSAAICDAVDSIRNTDTPSTPGEINLSIESLIMSAVSRAALGVAQSAIQGAVGQCGVPNSIAEAASSNVGSAAVSTPVSVTQAATSISTSVASGSGVLASTVSASTATASGLVATTTSLAAIGAAGTLIPAAVTAAVGLAGATQTEAAINDEPTTTDDTPVSP